MSKKKVYYNEAERLYAEEQLTINEIASKLNVAVRTINYWKKDKNWDDKREKFLREKSSFHERLYGFSQTLMDSIENDIKNGEKPDAGRMYTFTRVLPLIAKIKDYEEALKKATMKDDKTKNTLTKEDVMEIEKILGIRSHDDSENEGGQKQW